jgi:hypothetical protein
MDNPNYEIVDRKHDKVKLGFYSKRSSSKWNYIVIVLLFLSGALLIVGSIIDSF